MQHHSAQLFGVAENGFWDINRPRMGCMDDNLILFFVTDSYKTGIFWIKCTHYTLICTTISLQEIIFWPVCWWRDPNLKIQTNIFYSHHRTISPKVTITLLHYHNGSSWTRNNHPAVWRIRIKTFKNCVPQPKYGCLQAKISTYSLQILLRG